MVLWKRSKIVINLRWDALTIGSREVGINVHHRGSWDTTETYCRG